jgi:DNA-binding transcriptional MerR regulator
MKLLDISRVSDLVRRGSIGSALLRGCRPDRVGRQARLRRQFGPGPLLQLAFIRMGQAAGFSLDEIRDMFGKDGRPNVPRSDLRAKAVELDHQIRRLTALRNTLLACRRVLCAIASRLSESSNA